MSRSKYFMILTSFLAASFAQAQTFHLEAVCSVTQADPNGTSSKSLVSNKNLKLEIGAGETGAQTIGIFEGVEFRISSPLTISAPYVSIRGISSQQSVHAGRDIGGTISNLLTLSMLSPKNSLLSAVCNISISGARSSFRTQSDKKQDLAPALSLSQGDP